MSSVFVASQSSCFFLFSREQIRPVENRLEIRSGDRGWLLGFYTFLLIIVLVVKNRIQGPVVRRLDSTIQRVAIFSNFLRLFIDWYKPD